MELVTKLTEAYRYAEQAGSDVALLLEQDGELCPVFPEYYGEWEDSGSIEIDLALDRYGTDMIVSVPTKFTPHEAASILEPFVEAYRLSKQD